MLLSSLSILMGAILVPSDYLWVYSTHIILVCLYLIWSKRPIVLFLTLLSFVSILFHEFITTSNVPFVAGDTLLIDFDGKKLIPISAGGLNQEALSDSTFVRLVYFQEDGVRRTMDRFTIATSSLQLSEETLSQYSYHAVITGVLWPNKVGSWWEKSLYIKRQSAQLTVRFSTEAPSQLALPYSLRGHLLEKLDHALGSFPQWRFSKALLLGQDDLWSERDTWIVRTLGLAHLFVVSGLHAGFMFAIGRWMSGIVWRFLPDHMLLSGVTRWHCDAVIVIPLLIAYAYLTSWGEPVVRASIMLSVYLLARMQALKLSPFGIITFALWLVLLFEPRTVLSPGLWLSFSMVYLLIGYCQAPAKWSRLFMVQVMLSTASMVLILGWQDAISSVSIFINLLLIPFAAFLWFPWALASCVEVLVFGSTYSYEFLDRLLHLVVQFMERAAFELPLLQFEHFHSGVARSLMLILVVYWVYQSPLKRGVGGAMGVWCVLFSSSIIFHTTNADLILLNKNNKLVLMEAGQVLLMNSWVGEDVERLKLDTYLSIKQGGYFLVPNNLSELTPKMLIMHDVNWVVLKNEVTENTRRMLAALGINWVIVSDDENVEIYFRNNLILLRHSSCIYSFSLMKSDTCKRVEKFESVLNYLQT